MLKKSIYVDRKGRAPLFLEASPEGLDFAEIFIYWTSGSVYYVFFFLKEYSSHLLALGKEYSAVAWEAADFSFFQEFV